MLKKIIVIIFLSMSCLPITGFANEEYEYWIDSIDTKEISSYSETMPIKGWFFHKSEKVKMIKLFIDNKWVTNIEYGKQRRDVSDAYPRYPQSLNSGFEIEYKLDKVNLGKHVFLIKAITEHGKIIEVTSGQFVKEDIFKSWIDSPNSQIIKKNGEGVEIRGWVFNTIGIEEILVYLNDKKIGSANYKLQRSDVLNAFPNYSNAEFSGFEFKNFPKDIKPGKYKVDLISKSVDGSTKKFASMDITKKRDYTLFYVFFIVIVFYSIFVVLIQNRRLTLNNETLRLFNLFRIDVIWFVLSLTSKVLLFSNASNIKISTVNIFSSFAVILIIGSLFSFIKKFKVRLLILFIMNLIITLIFFSDMIYLRYFNDFISIFVIAYITQVSELGGSILELLRTSDIYYFLDLIFIVSLFFLKIPPVKLTKKIKVLSMVIVLIITILPLSSTLKNLYSDSGNVFAQTFSNVEVVKELGILNYHIFDVAKYFSTLLNKPKVTDKDERLVSNWFSSHEIFNEDAPMFGKYRSKNVILIQEESLQSFVINLMIDGQEITPNINKLLNESIYFENFYDQTHIGRTSDGELTTLTSLYPLREGTANFRYPNTPVITLPKVLKTNGYSTMSAHAFKGQFWNRKIMHSNYGFNKSMFYDDFLQKDISGWGLSDNYFFEQSVNYMKELEQPFFSFLISLSNHHPYEGVPEKSKQLNFGSLENTLMGNYLHSVHYADYAIGELIDELKKNNIYENSIIIFYGDHDAGIDPDEIRNISGGKLISNKLYDKVPFIIHIPNSKGEIRDEISGHLDITPTLLHLLGINSSEFRFMGNNLFLDNENSIIATRDGKFITPHLVNDNGCKKYPIGEEIESSNCDEILKEMKKRFYISDLLIKTNLSNR